LSGAIVVQLLAGVPLLWKPPTTTSNRQDQRYNEKSFEAIYGFHG